MRCLLAVDAKPARRFLNECFAQNRIEWCFSALLNNKVYRCEHNHYHVLKLPDWVVLMLHGLLDVVLVEEQVLADHVQVASMVVDVGWRPDFHQVGEMSGQQALAHLPNQILDDLGDLILAVSKDDAAFRLALIESPRRIAKLFRAIPV